MARANLYIDEKVYSQFEEQCRVVERLSMSQVFEEIVKDYLRLPDGLGEERRREVVRKKPGIKPSVAISKNCKNGNAKKLSRNKAGSHKIY